jgi:hypothetical protein
MSGGLTHGSHVALHRCMTCSTGSLTGASTFTNDEKLFDRVPRGTRSVGANGRPEKRSFGGKREWHLWVTGTVLFLTMFSITISFQVKGDPVCAIAGGQ